MTSHWVINLRGEVPCVGQVATAAAARALEGQLDPLPGWQKFAEAAANARHLLLITHGFNVKAGEGFEGLSATLAQMAVHPAFPAAGLLPVIVLWPGDWVVPVVNFPAAHRPAERAGRQLGEHVGRFAAAVPAISLMSHSLGARVVLEAVLALPAGRQVDTLCLTAAATDNDIFRQDKAGRYSAVPGRCRQVMVIHSRRDKVLRLAYPAGDFLADLFLRDRDSPFRAALGFHGPRPTDRPVVPPNFGIPDGAGVDHGDYVGAGAKRAQVAGLMARALAGRPLTWP